MTTTHINYQTALTIPQLLKSINAKYTAAHFGKWGIGVDPLVFGYDYSEAITGNKDGCFNYK